MTEAEIKAVLAVMKRDADEVIGFRTLLESDQVRMTPVERIELDAYMVASGHGLALKVLELERRVWKEGIRS